MSRFQSTISTCAALGTIAVTAVTAYKAIENNKTYNAEQEAKIEQLQTQLKQLPPSDTATTGRVTTRGNA